LLLILDGKLAVTTQQRLFARAAVLALSVGLPSLAEAETRADCELQYTPQRAQSGKDVIWVPTGDEVVVRMLELAGVTSADRVYDLGAGDGKIAIAAGKRFGATAVGVEYNADLAKYAQCLVEVEGVQSRVTVVQGDIFETDFSDATVVTLYLLPELNMRLRPALLDMKPGTRVVSYSFTMRDWPFDEHAETDEGLAYLWIVPAKIGGAWTFRPRNGDERFDITFDQTFQNLEGLTGSAAVTGKLSGQRIDFAFLDGDEQTRFTGTVESDRISGTMMRDGKTADYVGTRKKP
jgi:SAM-dependent methyltransferase